MPGVFLLFAVVAMSFACVLHLAMSSCALHHHVFKTCIRPCFPQFHLLSILSPDTLARACGTSEILFLLVAGKCSRDGLKVGVRSYYSVGRPPAKFHRVRSPFDAQTNNYSGSIAGQTSDVFGLRKRLPGCLLSSPLISAQPLFTAH